MSKITKQELQEQLESLRKQNKGLAQDRIEYFDRMTNAQLVADQAAFERDEALKELDSLKEQLKAAKEQLKQVRATATRQKSELSDLRRHNKILRETNDISRELLTRREKEIEALKAAKASGGAHLAIPDYIENPKRGRPVSITEDQRRYIMALREQKLSIRSIAQAVGVSVGSVQRILSTDKS